MRAAVLTDDGAGEVLVHPGALAAQSASGEGGDNRSAELRRTERSIRSVNAAPAPATEPSTGACAVVSSGESPPAIGLDESRCATVASGGAVRIVLGAHELALTLTSDRHWLIIRLQSDVAGSPDQIGLFDAASASSLLLNSATGAETTRTIPADAPSGGAAMFDAVVASVRHSEAAQSEP